MKEKITTILEWGWCGFGWNPPGTGLRLFWVRIMNMRGSVWGAFMEWRKTMRETRDFLMKREN